MAADLNRARMTPRMLPKLGRYSLSKTLTNFVSETGSVTTLVPTTPSLACFGSFELSAYIPHWRTLSQSPREAD